MATVTITIPDAIIPRLRDAMHWKFPETVGVADGTAFKDKTAEYWRQILIDYEGTLAETEYAAAQAGAVSTARAQASTDGSGIG